jgi:hypothetical protein
MEKGKIREKAGDFFIDIAKLVFGGVVLSVILDFEMNKAAILSAGVITTASLAWLGFYLYNRKK